jgi:hypothetical protein
MTQKGAKSQCLILQTFLPPHAHEMNLGKNASLNINGITAPTLVGMLTDFIRRHEFDNLFMQEVTSPEILNTTGYATT